VLPSNIPLHHLILTTSSIYLAAFQHSAASFYPPHISLCVAAVQHIVPLFFPPFLLATPFSISTLIVIFNLFSLPSLSSNISIPHFNRYRPGTAVRDFVAKYLTKLDTDNIATLLHAANKNRRVEIDEDTLSDLLTIWEKRGDKLGNIATTKIFQGLSLVKGSRDLALAPRMLKCLADAVTFCGRYRRKLCDCIVGVGLRAPCDYFESAVTSQSFENICGIL
jgi:hypothetical protein